jgi:5S rRNA maturation endonuclease (ribonuclease M5)
VRNASAKSTVLVQHKKDAEILRSLGVKHVYYYQEPEHQLLQAIADIRRPCIVLWDATRPGNAKCQRITDTLQKLGVEVNTRFRKFLFTTPFKALSGLLSFIHAHVYDSPRKHEGVRF